MPKNLLRPLTEKHRLLGFTLVELIVVITILAILGTVGFLSLKDYGSSAKNTVISSNLRTISTALTNAVGSEGASYRKYISHDPSYALSSASITIGSGQVLTGGAYGTAGTNYSVWSLNLNALSGLRAGMEKDDRWNAFVAAGVDYSNYLYSPPKGTSAFQVAGTILENGIDKSIVLGNYVPNTASGDTMGLISYKASASPLTTPVVNSTSATPYPYGWKIVIDGTCGSANGSSFASAPSTNLCSAGTASAVSGSWPWNWTCTGTGGGSNASCSAVLAATRYPGCNTDDIILWNGQVWAACNVGASTAFTGYQAGANDSPVSTETTAGKYFQWGENAAWDYDGGVASTDNCAWDRDTQSCGASLFASWQATVSDTTIGGTDRWLDWVDTRGPCAPGYRVPTSTEWDNAHVALGSNRNTFASTLKLPMAGHRSYGWGGIGSQGSTGYYWSSSPSGSWGVEMRVFTNVIQPNQTWYRASGNSVRCIHN